MRKEFEYLEEIVSFYQGLLIISKSIILCKTTSELPLPFCKQSKELGVDFDEDFMCCFSCF